MSGLSVVVFLLAWLALGLGSFRLSAKLRHSVETFEALGSRESVTDPVDNAIKHV